MNDTRHRAPAINLECSNILPKSVLVFEREKVGGVWQGNRRGSGGRELGMAAGRTTLALGVASLLLVAYASAHDFVRFGYRGAIGPDKWGGLCPDYELCSKGKHQSPINIVKDDVVYDPTLEPLQRDYAATNATLVDNGFNIALRYDSGVGHVIVGGKNYTLIQMHWHSPSEHTIDGERFPVELHLVHSSDDGNITVVAILYQFGHPDPFLFQIKNKVAELAKEVCAGDEEAHVPVGIVQTRAMKRHSRKYFRYVGSLSTPPCTENVIWNILGKVREMTAEQLAELKAPLHEEYYNNSRPTQPLNGRTVLLYDESKAS
ncbi:unnamed protein product [Musa acuminata subsp. burmannicoides]